MTDDELKELADQVIARGGLDWHVKLAQGYLALLARLDDVEAQRDRVIDVYQKAIDREHAERGEVVKACPDKGCHSLAIDKAEPDTGTLYECLDCGGHFDEPAHWQRVKGPQA